MELLRSNFWHLEVNCMTCLEFKWSEGSLWSLLVNKVSVFTSTVPHLNALYTSLRPERRMEFFSAVIKHLKSQLFWIFETCIVCIPVYLLTILALYCSLKSNEEHSCANAHASLCACIKTNKSRMHPQRDKRKKPENTCWQTDRVSFSKANDAVISAL